MSHPKFLLGTARNRAYMRDTECLGDTRCLSLTPGALAALGTYATGGQEFGMNQVVGDRSLTLPALSKSALYSSYTHVPSINSNALPSGSAKKHVRTPPWASLGG